MVRRRLLLFMTVFLMVLSWKSIRVLSTPSSTEMSSATTPQFSSPSGTEATSADSDVSTPDFTLETSAEMSASASSISLNYNQTSPSVISTTPLSNGEDISSFSTFPDTQIISAISMSSPEETTSPTSTVLSIQPSQDLKTSTPFSGKETSSHVTNQGKETTSTLITTQPPQISVAFQAIFGSVVLLLVIVVTAHTCYIRRFVRYVQKLKGKSDYVEVFPIDNPYAGFHTDKSSENVYESFPQTAASDSLQIEDSI